MTVIFDAATDGQEAAGDGVITISHTATGTDLAAFAGGGISTVATSATTYDGVSMTELWDGLWSFADSEAHCGYALAAIPSGTKNVVNTFTGGTPNLHAFGVVTFTGVNQTTPVGTAVATKGQSATPASTVADADSNDLVVDSTFIDCNGTTPTIGADQTLRNSEDIGITRNFRQSTQPGSAGGVMSWTITSNFWAHGAVAFKPLVPMLPLLGVGT